MIGAGSWGIALAYLLAGNGHHVTLWSHSQAGAERLKQERGSHDKLPGVELPDSVCYTCELSDAIRDAEMLVMVIPSAHMRETARLMKPFMIEAAVNGFVPAVKNGPAPGCVLVNCSKGIEEGTLMTLSEILEEELPGYPVAALSGPSHAEEVGRGMPTAVVAGAADADVAVLVQNAFMSPVFRVYTSEDMIGIEVGAALKNVVALAAGMADGLGYGDNTRAGLITRGIAEIARLGMAMGGKLETFAGLTGIGDLIVTCTSMHSRNHRAGILIGQGKSAKEAMEEVKMVVEGVYSAKAALALSRTYNVEMPIVEQVCAILFDGKSVKVAVEELMLRDKKAEA